MSPSYTKVAVAQLWYSCICHNVDSYGWATLRRYLIHRVTFLRRDVHMCYNTVNQFDLNVNIAGKLMQKRGPQSVYNSSVAVVGHK